MEAHPQLIATVQLELSPLYILYCTCHSHTALYITNTLSSRDLSILFPYHFHPIYLFYLRRLNEFCLFAYHAVQCVV